MVLTASVELNEKGEVLGIGFRLSRYVIKHFFSALDITWNWIRNERRCSDYLKVPPPPRGVEVHVFSIIYIIRYES